MVFGVLLAIVTVKGKHQGLVIQLTFGKNDNGGVRACVINLLLLWWLFWWVVC